MHAIFDRKRVMILLFLCLTIGIFLVTWFLIARSVLFSETDLYEDSTENAPVVSSHNDSTGDLLVRENEVSSQKISEKMFSGFSDADIRKGQVKWQEPEDLGDLGWTRKDVYDGTYRSTDETGRSGGVHYAKVGTIIDGTYSGWDILVVASWLFDGDFPRGDWPFLHHYLRKGNEVVSLPNAETRNGETFSSGSADVSQYDDISDEQKILTLMPPNERVERSVRIEELVSYPEEIQGRSDREVLVRDPYANAAFFSNSRLKSAFTHSEFGQVWMMDATSKQIDQLKLNSFMKLVSLDENTSDNPAYVHKRTYYTPIVPGGFYLKKVDGTTETYRLKVDAFSTLDRTGVLLATWNDGVKNITEYEEYPSGCGGSAYAYDVTGTLDIKKDLVPIGKTDQNDVLYGYKESHKELKAYFTDTYLPMAEGDSDNEVSENEQWKNFVGRHPIVFWQDPFGRLLKFYNTETMEIAECGKPVVYLYPEKVTDVSVRVFPNEGVSISDPEYGDGWQVTARPDGTLLNSADDKEYPYLFWEGGSSIIYRIPEQGFVTSNENLNGFFDEKLSRMGLSQKEIFDFKEFWIPTMKELEKPYYFVTFLSRKEIDRLAPLEIYPKPDTIIRVMMDYEGLDEWKNVPGFSIHPPERKGFTAVEWGGRLK